MTDIHLKCGVFNVPCGRHSAGDYSCQPLATVRITVRGHCKTDRTNQMRNLGSPDREMSVADRERRRSTSSGAKSSDPRMKDGIPRRAEEEAARPRGGHAATLFKPAGTIVLGRLCFHRSSSTSSWLAVGISAFAMVYSHIDYPHISDEEPINSTERTADGFGSGVNGPVGRQN